MAVIMTTLTMLVSIPLVGLAVDVSVLYMIRGKLFQAVDSASLAGARALANGANTNAQTSSAQAEATKFFNANFPASYWGTSNITFATPTVDTNTTPNYRTVTTSATVSAPLYFLRILGQNSTTISVSSQAGRRDVALMLVLDRSSSMNNPFDGTTACAIMKTDAVQFLSYFAPQRDMIGLVVFGSGVFAYAPTTNFTTPDGNGNTVASLINQINCNGNTNTAGAMQAAYQQIVNTNALTRSNVIVLMTDGRPNGFDGKYTNLRINPGSCDVAGNPLIGVAAQWAGGPLANGTTAGLMPISSNSVNGNDRSAAANSGGCNMANNLTNVRNDVTKMPSKDIYGNSTLGPYSTLDPNPPYNGLPGTQNISIPAQVEIAAVNAVDNEGTTIRSNAALKPAIYVVALEGNAPTDPPDTLLLRKMANDPTMQNDPSATAQAFWTSQNPGQTVGYFVDAPDPSELCAAFNSIAERIVVRLAK
jgi:Flp pilus assembly protein TadG